MVDEVVVEPFGVPKQSFFVKAETRRNGAALLIAGRTADLDPIQLSLVEGVTDQCQGSQPSPALDLGTPRNPVPQ